MAMTREGDLLKIDGAASVEDADEVVAFLNDSAAPAVDLAAASHLHAAVFQAILAYRPRIVAAPRAEGPRAALAAAGVPVVDTMRSAA